MNIFYAPKEQVFGEIIELGDQEATHAAKVLRYREGDSIVIVDGEGGRYHCEIKQVNLTVLKAKIQEKEQVPILNPLKVLAMGLIKKRDRLEFAVEKAVELGVSDIALFRSRHSVKQNVRMDRLEATVLSAMKQSLRAWLPGVTLYDSLEDIMEHYSDYRMLLAHKAGKDTEQLPDLEGAERLLALVGPEGGFSQQEIEFAKERGAESVSLGNYRLRTETAAITLLSRLP